MNEKFQKVTFEELQNLKTVLSFSTRYKIKSFKHPKLDERIFKLFRKDSEFWIYSQEECEKYDLKNTKQVEKKDRFIYCKSKIEGNKFCNIQCEHCKIYYAPLEKNFVK